MPFIHYFCIGCFVFLAVTIQLSQPTCVLESDFGFKINCAFKKSGLFRVRNLGGLKAHASLGFSLGDELGFEQSLTNLDTSRRRSVSIKNGVPPNLVAGSSARPNVKQEKRGKQNRIMMRPQMPPSSRPNPAAVETLSSLHRRVSSTMQPIVVASPTMDTPSVPKFNTAPQATLAKPLPMGLPPFRPLPPKEDNLKVLPIAQSTKKTYTPLQIPQSKGPALAYQSENRYPHISQDQVAKMVSQMTASHMPHLSQHQNNGLVRITHTPFVIENYTPRVTMTNQVPIFHLPTTVNPFVPMPIAAPPTQAAISIIPGPVFKDSVQIPLAPSMLSKTPTAYSLAQNTISIHKMPASEAAPNPISNFVDPVPHHINDLANQLYPAYNTKKVDEYNTITGYGDDTTLSLNKNDINEKIAEIAKAGNISMEAVEAAIALRQQQILSKFANIQVPGTTTTTTTTTEAPPLVFQSEPEVVYSPVTPKQKRHPNPTSGKVMNAPKEYYPVGYEKNFDDQFQSKVDLPDTNFHCGDQKYFPGLYGDENLGCMVFHVCALTDDGLVMKSFLCPESTLFDQTILKCNWWFYVDCKSSRKLYDTNIPVSKSYQLMKALTFFSSYKKDNQDDGGRSKKPEEMEGIEEAITILENHDNDNHKVNKQDAIHIITPRPGTFNTESNIYRINSGEQNDQNRYTRTNRNFRNITSTTPKAEKINNNSGKPKDMETGSSEIKLVTVNADMSFNQSSLETSKENLSKERVYRRRQVSRRRNVRTTTIKPTTTSKPEEISTSTTTEIPKHDSNKEIVNIDDIKVPTDLKVTTEPIKEEKLTDQVDKVEKIEPSILKEGELSPPVKRFYRSSAEALSREITLIKNEPVQIVRPTHHRLVGEYATPAAAIAKLDDAVLGRSHVRHKKEAYVTIVTPQKNRDLKESLSST